MCQFLFQSGEGAQNQSMVLAPPPHPPDPPHTSPHRQSAADQLVLTSVAADSTRTMLMIVTVSPGRSAGEVVNHPG